MSKIGIITYWGIPNYGTFLQGYALKKVIGKLRPDADVEVVPYVTNRHYNTYYSKESRAYVGDGVEDVFINAYNDVSNLTRITEKELESKNYDQIVIGSDIIWCYTIDFISDRHMFGIGINAGNKISYAASFGTVRKDAILPADIKEAINNMSAVSVRDYGSKTILQNNGRKYVDIVLDPTMLWDFEHDPNFQYDNKYEDYIAIYGDAFSDDYISQVQEYCAMHGLKTLSAGDGLDWCDISLTGSDISPYEWPGIIKNSKGVMTCTFHGLMFALKFNRPIIYYPTDFIASKISFIVSGLGLDEPLVEKKRFEERIAYKWDYQTINMKMEHLKKYGLDFLESHII